MTESATRARLAGVWPSLARDGAGGGGDHTGIARLPGDRRRNLVCSLRPGSRPSTPSAPAMPSMVRWRLALARRERSDERAVAWANAAAALAVTQPGAQSALPFRDAIDQLAARAAAC